MPRKTKLRAAQIVEVPADLSAGLRPAATYHRTSTRDQDPALARTELLAAARARGFAVVLEVTEAASGARSDRPGLARVMEAARRGQVAAVLCWKLDRFGRSTLDLIANVRTLVSCGVRFVATSQAIDVGGAAGGDALGNLMLTVLSAVAEFERELIKERIALGIAKARREGRQLGRRRALDAPAPHAVRRERDAGLSWSETAAKLGCTVAMARRRHGEAPV